MTADRTCSDLQSLWRAWTDVVYGRTWNRRRTTAAQQQEYIVLHERLLQVIQRERSQSKDPMMSELYVKASDLARPWVTLQAFQCADHTALRSLIQQCRFLDQHFLPHHFLSFRRFAVILFIMFALCAGSIIAIKFGNDSTSVWSSLGDSMLHFWRRLSRQRYLMRGSEFPIVGLLGAVILVGFWCFWFPKKY